MTPRSPPTRPHIGINPANHFASGSAADWGEDDAWDSTSDSEEPRQSTLTSTWSRPTSITAPKPVPRPSNRSSSSTLAFSYTHVSAPNPGSYPPKSEEVLQAPKNGWTIVRKSPDDRRSDSLPRGDSVKPKTEEEGAGDIDVEGDMILGDLEPELAPEDVNSSLALAHVKLKQNQGSIREDIQDVVNGI